MNSGTKQILSVTGLVVNTFIWGLTFIMVKWTVSEMDTFYFLFLRFLVAFILMAIIFRKHLRPDKYTIKSSLILGIILSTSFFVQTDGLRYTTATNSAMITGLYLVIIPIILSLFYKTSSRVTSIIGAVISVIGLFLLTRYSFTGFNYGDFLTLLCAIGYAWHIVLNGKFTAKHEAIPLVTYQFLFVSIFFGIAVLFKGSYTLHIPNIGWLTVLVCAVPGTAFAILIQTIAQKHIDSTRVGIIFALEAVFGALFAYLLGNESMTKIALIGACLMVGGMIISELHPLAKYLFKKVVG